MQGAHRPRPAGARGLGSPRDEAVVSRQSMVGPVGAAYIGAATGIADQDVDPPLSAAHELICPVDAEERRTRAGGPWRTCQYTLA